MKKDRIAFLFVLMVTVWGCSKNDPQPTIAENTTKVADIAYIAGDTSSRHKLDVYYKKGTNSKKVILFVPGGAWKQGDKDKYEELAVTLDSLYGYTVVVANYRLSDSDAGSAIHPDHVEDVAMAFAWVKKNISQYGGNPEAVFLFGQSAGGHLVSLLASDEQYLKHVGYSFNDIGGVISMSGAYALDALAEFPQNPLGLSVEEVLMYKALVANAFGSYDTSVLMQASPSHHINSSMPPFLVIYTEFDMPGFDMVAESFYSGLKQAGVSSVSINKLYKSDYSATTWQTATILAAEEPSMSGYIGHYAEVVAINEFDYSNAPTKWIVTFVNSH